MARKKWKKSKNTPSHTQKHRKNLKISNFPGKEIGAKLLDSKNTKKTRLPKGSRVLGMKNRKVIHVRMK